MIKKKKLSNARLEKNKNKNSLSRSTGTRSVYCYTIFFIPKRWKIQEFLETDGRMLKVKSGSL